MHTKIHLPWHYDSLINRLLPTKYNAYHLKMVFNNDRSARKNLYEAQDPNHECQTIGYTYLTDTEGIKLLKINKTQEYDYMSLPDDYYRLLSKS